MVKESWGEIEEACDPEEAGWLSRERWSFKQDDWSTSLSLRTHQICRLCWYGRSYWKQGRCSCLPTWQPLPRGNRTGWDSSPLWEWLGELSFVSFFLNQFSSVTQSCLTLCEPMDCSTPGFPVHHQLSELAQTHVHRVGDAIQPSHPLSSPSPPAFRRRCWSFPASGSFPMSQFFTSGGQSFGASQLQHQSFQWIFRTDFL